MVIKLCVVCGSEFNAIKTHITCSKNCSTTRERERGRRWEKNNLKQRREQKKRERENNPNKVKEQLKEWRKKNVDWFDFYQIKREKPNLPLEIVEVKAVLRRLKREVRKLK